jgi:hypothetical protein
MVGAGGMPQQFQQVQVLPLQALQVWNSFRSLEVKNAIVYYILKRFCLAVYHLRSRSFQIKRNPQGLVEVRDHFTVTHLWVLFNFFFFHRTVFVKN